MSGEHAAERPDRDPAPGPRPAGDEPRAVRAAAPGNPAPQDAELEGAAPGRAGRDDAAADDDGGWRRVHRASPVLRFWQAFAVGAAAILVNMVNSGFGAIVDALVFAGEHWAWTLLGIVGVPVVTVGAAWLLTGAWWRATGFRLTGEELQRRRGVFSKEQRSARYDRIQAVDVVENLVPRLFKLASIRVETAGGNDSAINIEFLPRREAEELRAELLVRAKGADGEHAPAPGGAAAPGAGDAPGGRSAEEVLVEEIPVARSLAGAALTGGTVATAVGGLFLLVVFLGVAIAFDDASFFGVVPFLVALVVGSAGPIWQLLDRSWRFTAILERRPDASDVVHLRYGLATKRRQSVPVDRVHAVRIGQGALWRRRGWYKLSVDVAGYTPGQSSTNDLLPIGSRSQALAVASVLTGRDAEEIARIADPDGATEPDYRSPRAARWFSPIDYRRHAATLTDGIAAWHWGRFGRNVSFIDAGHIQELTVRTGPLQRRLGLATVVYDLVAGPVSMSAEHLAVSDAWELTDRLRERRLPSLAEDPAVREIREAGGPAARPGGPAGDE
ncbi:PH domain-containing protein [Corynebacterium otitidis]|nr:PH domain-containing protein [Corynebacterium otitidis]